MTLAVLFGWSLSGQRLEMPRPFRRGKRFSLIGAMCSVGMIALNWVEGSVDGELFVRWFREDVRPHLQESDVVVMDNARIHKSGAFSEYCEREGIKVVYLPPYSPEFNPIELAWSKMKALIRRLAPREEGALLAAIQKALESLTESDAQGWFRHCIPS